MKLTDGLILIFCGVGIAQSLFFAVFLLTYKEGSRISNRILAILLVALAIRLGKSLTYYFFSLDPWFMNIGYAAHVALAPLLLLYMLSLGKQWSVCHLLHLIPCLIIVALSANLSESFWLSRGYTWLLYYSLIYLVACWIVFYRSPLRTSSNPVAIRWIYGLMFSVSILCLAYYSNFILRLTSYIAGPFIYSILIYVLSYLGLRFYDNIFGLKIPLRKASVLPSEESRSYFERLNSLLVEEQLFLNPDINLTLLAERVGIPSYRLSQIINGHHSAGFTDLINAYRIEAARKRLVDPLETEVKIATIAFESGFNTLSAFNSAFKKMSGQTPSAYRHLKNGQRITE